MESGTELGSPFSALKENIAERLERAAGSLGGQAEEGAATGPCGRQAAEWLHQSAAYVRDFDIKRADMQLRDQIRAHPGRSILAALAAGIIIGFWIRRR